MHAFPSAFANQTSSASIQRLAAILHGEIDNRRRPAKCGGARSGFEVVGRGGSAKWKIHMGVWIDSTRDNELACSIDGSVETTDDTAEVLANQRHGRAIDKNIGHVGIHRRNDVSIPN